jgi:precorrin-2 dehydrogenase/sirohydrochlorin ferrochelatase
MTSDGDPPATPPRFSAQLDLDGAPCLVVGGGVVATRRALRLLESGAVVTVIAPDATEQLRRADLTHHARFYEDGEAASYRLVVAATDDADVNARVQRDAELAGAWCNRADQSGGGALAFPAVPRTGRVGIAVSTEGASPMLAQWATRRIVHTLDPTVASLADLLADRRAEAIESGAEVDRPVGNGQVGHALDLRRDDE